MNTRRGVTPSGSAYCWGWNGGGALGDGTTTSTAAPVAVAGGLTFANLTAGVAHSCGVTVAHVAYCWGEGPLGSASTGSSTVPVKVAGQP